MKTYNGSIAIATDSNSGITQSEAESLGVYVLPMPFCIDGKMHLEGVDLSRGELFAALDADADVSTSQPSPASITELWDRALRDFERVIYMPMSSGLSGSCAVAEALAADYGGRVIVVDNKRISVPLRFAVEDAISMANRGMDADAIADVLRREALESSVYITVDTLKFLKKGGRITAAGAALGTVLGIKPVLMVAGGKLDAYAKVRGLKPAKKAMLEALAADLSGRFAGCRMRIAAAYTCTDEEAAEWKHEIEEYFPGHTVIADPLALSVACHTGRGAIGIGCAREPEL